MKFSGETKIDKVNRVDFFVLLSALIGLVLMTLAYAVGSVYTFASGEEFMCITNVAGTVILGLCVRMLYRELKYVLKPGRNRVGHL